MTTPAERAHEELEALRVAYERAKSFIASPLWAATQKQILDRIMFLTRISGAASAESAEKILGRIAECLRPLEEPLAAVSAYESKRKSVERIDEAAG